MRLPPRRYQAMGAAIVAGAVTARYVAKWRRRRLRRLGEQREVTFSSNKVFVGISFPDRLTESQLSCSVAMIDSELRCHFSVWQFREDGLGILPNTALGKSFTLAISGPQGLAANENAVSRESEQKTNTSRKTPYSITSDKNVKSELIRESTTLFYNLVSSGSRFRLLGLHDTSVRDANLIEVSADTAWSSMARTALPAKVSLEGRRRRAELLQGEGVDFISGPLISDIQLDSAICAWTAFCLESGKAQLVGTSPFADSEENVFREGFIIQPDINAFSSDSDSESFAPV